ncbi:hypothetical protein [Streptomyces griseochromogenes]|uniref:hypothetical protein n=1 Tax=Streptomyces griseochromogenes TaxID=68214 RepID=UPI0037B98A65
MGLKGDSQGLVLQGQAPDVVFVDVQVAGEVLLLCAQAGDSLLVLVGVAGAGLGRRAGRFRLESGDLIGEVPVEGLAGDVEAAGKSGDSGPGPVCGVFQQGLDDGIDEELSRLVDEEWLAAGRRRDLSLQ